MRLIAFGGDERLSGALAAARARGWETLHVRAPEDAAGKVVRVTVERASTYALFGSADGEEKV